MDSCWECGGDIIFRYVSGQLTPIHLDGSCSGGYYQRAQRAPTAPHRWSPVSLHTAASTSWSQGHARSDSSEPFTHPTHCPLCGACVFFRTNGNGDVVFFDEFGPPWPRHPCLTSQNQNRRASASRELMRLVDLPAAPSAIAVPACCSKANVTRSLSTERHLLGLVLRNGERTTWLSHAGSFVPTRMTVSSLTVCTSCHQTTTVYLPDLKLQPAATFGTRV
jgi:hypothetical protein